MSTSYYCLVAGLTEQSLEGEHKGFDAVALRDEIAAALTPADTQHLRTLYLPYDIENILAQLGGKSSHNPLGILPEEAVAAAISGEESEEMGAEQSMPLGRELPPAITRILTALRHAEGLYEDEIGTIDPAEGASKLLWGWYYAEAERSTCPFVREWAAFDRTLRNLCAAFAARRAGLPISEHLVGEGIVVEGLAQSAAADFGLRGELPYLDGVLTLLENPNLLEKEHRLDLIRWSEAEEITTFDYFTLGTLLAYLMKVNIIHRWVALDATRGAELLKKLLTELADPSIVAQAEAS